MQFPPFSMSKFKAELRSPGVASDNGTKPPKQVPASEAVASSATHGMLLWMLSARPKKYHGMKEQKK
jgi:hypothetical protein